MPGSHIDVGGSRAGIGRRVDVQTRAHGWNPQTQFVGKSPAECQESLTCRLRTGLAPLPVGFATTGRIRCSYQTGSG